MSPHGSAPEMDEFKIIGGFMVYDMFPDYDELYGLDDYTKKQLENVKYEKELHPVRRKNLEKIFGNALYK